MGVVKPRRGVGSGGGLAAGDGEAAGEAVGEAVASTEGDGLVKGEGVGVAGRGVSDSTGPGDSSDSHVYAALVEPWKKSQPTITTATAPMAVKMSVRYRSSTPGCCARRERATRVDRESGAVVVSPRTGRRDRLATAGKPPAGFYAMEGDGVSHLRAQSAKAYGSSRFSA
jgi:hypothetical protein